MEKIKSACIKYRLKTDPNTDRFVEGPNHGFCIECFSFIDIYANQRVNSEEVQGFMTTEGRFVNRSEAYKIAKEAGQLIKEHEGEWLDSYNVRFA